MNIKTIVSVGLPVLLIISSFIPGKYKKWVFLKFGMYRYIIIVPVFGIVLAMFWMDLRALFPMVMIFSLLALFWDWRTLKRMKG